MCVEEELNLQKEYQFKDPKTTVLIEDDSVVFRRGTNDLMIHKMMRGDTKVFITKSQPSNTKSLP